MQNQLFEKKHSRTLQKQAMFKILIEIIIKKAKFANFFKLFLDIFCNELTNLLITSQLRYD